MFVRFVVGADAENAARLTGIIMEAETLQNEGHLLDCEAQRLVEAFAWLNTHLPCPPFKRKLRSGEWTSDAVCWFRSEAHEPIGRLWDIVAILREQGVPVRLIRTEKPGRIIYEDMYQIVAETPYWA